MMEININDLTELLEKGSNKKFTQLHSVTINGLKYNLWGINVTFEIS